MVRTWFVYRVDDPYHEIVEETLFGGHRKKIDFSYTQADLKHLEEMRALVKSWCSYSGFLKTAQAHVRDGKNSLIPVLLHGQNFRALAREDKYQAFIRLLMDTELDRSMERIFGLHLRLMTEIPKPVLDKYVNNLYRALEIVSPGDGTDLWQARHVRRPYLWVCLPIQNCLLESVPMA